MTIVDFFVFALLASWAAMIWGSLQKVDGDKVKGYKKVNEELWVETKVPGDKKTRFPDLWEPVIPPKK